METIRSIVTTKIGKLRPDDREEVIKQGVFNRVLVTLGEAGKLPGEGGRKFFSSDDLQLNVKDEEQEGVRKVVEDVIKEILG